MSTHCDDIVIFPINGQFGAIRKSGSGRIVFKTYIFIKSNFLSYKKTEKRTKIFLKTSQNIALSKGNITANKW